MMFKKEFIWHVIANNGLFAGGIVRSKGERYMESGNVTSIRHEDDDYLAIEISEWRECNFRSSKATWHISRIKAGTTLFVEYSMISIENLTVDPKAVTMLEFEVPGLGYCAVYSAGLVSEPRLESCDFVPQQKAEHVN